MSDKSERALQAHHLLEEGLMAEVWAKAEADYIEQWRAARTPRRREDLHHRIAAMDQLKADLRSIIVTGEIEKKFLEKVWPR